VTRVSADGATIIATKQSTVTTASTGYLRQTRVAVRPSGMVAAVSDGGLVYTAAVDASLAVGKLTLIVDSPSSVFDIALASGGTSFALAWTTTATISFLRLDDTGRPATAPEVFTRGGLLATVQVLGTRSLPLSMAESSAGWWLGWMENVTGRLIVSGMAGLVTCTGP